MKALGLYVVYLGLWVFFAFVLGMALTEGGYPPRIAPLEMTDR